MMRVPEVFGYTFPAPVPGKPQPPEEGNLRTKAIELYLKANPDRVSYGRIPPQSLALLSPGLLSLGFSHRVTPAFIVGKSDPSTYYLERLLIEHNSLCYAVVPRKENDPEPADLSGLFSHTGPDEQFTHVIPPRLETARAEQWKWDFSSLAYSRIVNAEPALCPNLCLVQPVPWTTFAHHRGYLPWFHHEIGQVLFLAHTKKQISPEAEAEAIMAAEMFTNASAFLSRRPDDREDFRTPREAAELFWLSHHYNLYRHLGFTLESFTALVEDTRAKLRVARQELGVVQVLGRPEPWNDQSPAAHAFKHPLLEVAAPLEGVGWKALVRTREGRSCLEFGGYPAGRLSTLYLPFTLGARHKTSFIRTGYKLESAVID